MCSRRITLRWHVFRAAPMPDTLLNSMTRNLYCARYPPVYSKRHNQRHRQRRRSRPGAFAEEARALERDGGVDLHASLRLSRKMHLILPTHRLLDAAGENAKGTARIGTTGKGIGPTYTDKAGRNGLRLGDIDYDFEAKYTRLKATHLDRLARMGAQVDADTLARNERHGWRLSSIYAPSNA